jgi:hypothetical protein
VGNQRKGVMVCISVSDVDLDNVDQLANKSLHPDIPRVQNLHEH